MRVLVLSIGHGEQLLPTEVDKQYPHIVQGKANLSKHMKEIIEARKIDLICEESNPDEISIAQEEAWECDQEIPYKNIVMTKPERIKARIDEALSNRPSHTVEIGEMFRSIEHRIPEDDIREEFFKDQIIKEAKCQKAKSTLVLCGDMHSQPLGTKLKAAGYEVDVDRTLTPIQLWQ